MQTKRNIGIDLLKIVSMLMIVTLHMLGHGGVLDNMPPMSRCYQVAWLIEIACYGAVNCYALASGFLTARCNIRKLMELWLQVMFYSLLITMLWSVQCYMERFQEKSGFIHFFLLHQERTGMLQPILE